MEHVGARGDAHTMKPVPSTTFRTSAAVIGLSNAPSGEMFDGVGLFRRPTTEAWRASTVITDTAAATLAGEAMLRACPAKAATPVFSSAIDTFSQLASLWKEEPKSSFGAATAFEPSALEKNATWAFSSAVTCLRKAWDSGVLAMFRLVASL